MRHLTITVFLVLTSILKTFGQENNLDKGNTYLNTEQYDKAEQAFRAGIKAEPTNLIYQCQLGLTLIEQKKYSDAEKVIDKVLKKDSNNIAAVWYSGIGNFYNAQDRKAISRFEKSLTLLDKKTGQYSWANWFIGKCYSNLLKTEGLTFAETDRMFECYETYLRLEPNAEDGTAIKEYIERKKKRRPQDNVKKWVDL